MATLDFDASLAVVIGINQYGNGIAPLRTALADAEAIAQRLEKQHDYKVISLLDTHAHLDALQHLIQTELSAHLTADSRLLFYFAGHGIAQDGDDGPKGYLIPQDAIPGNTRSYLPMVELHDALTELPCRHFLAIFDCCFAGAFRWSSTRDILLSEQVIHRERFDRFRQDPAWQVITSASHDQKAMDVMTLQDTRGAVGEHSPFAAALIQALEGAADTSPPAQNGKPAGDGVLTATELYLYLRDTVEPLTEDKQQRQTPEICALSKHRKGEFIFLTPGHTLNLPPAPELNRQNNPYRGLASFDTKDADLFFGRQLLISELTEFVEAHPLTVVLGSSGTGKSSLVKAGLIPALTHNPEQTWHVLPVIRPGESPLKSLAKAILSLEAGDTQIHQIEGLSTELYESPEALTGRVMAWKKLHPQKQLLLVIDQFEEVVTLCQQDKVRQQFLELLQLGATAQNRLGSIVITLRSDFEAQFLDTALKSSWMNARFIVPPMNREELRQVIEQPATKRVLYFDPPALIERLLDDVVQTPGALPLLSFTLSELYLRYLERRSDNRALTETDYDALGGIAGSLTQRATQEYRQLAQLDPRYENTVRNVMLRMVSLEGGELARRRVPETELVYSEKTENQRVQTVIKAFIEARLLVKGQTATGQPYVEPAHDALVRGWPQLLRWQRQAQEEMLLKQPLDLAVTAWENKQGSLWNKDRRLGLLQNTLTSENAWLNRSETEFVKQSIRLRWKNKWRFRIGISALVFASLAVGGGMSALRNAALKAKQNAEQSEQIAQRGKAEASLKEKSARASSWVSMGKAAEGLSLSLGVLSQSTKDPEYHSSVEYDAQKSIRDAVQLAREKNILLGHDQSVMAVAYDPKQGYIASSGKDRSLRVWNAESGTPLLVKATETHDSSIYSLDFSPDGKYLVSAGNDAALRIWEIEQPQGDSPLALTLKSTITDHDSSVRAVAFNRDSNRIVSASEDKTLRLWDVETGEQIGATMEGHSSSVWAVAFSPDGQSIVSGSVDKTIKLWDVTTTEEKLLPRMAHKDAVFSVAFDAESKRIVSGSADRSLRIWDAETGKLIDDPLKGHDGKIYSAIFSADGQTIISTGSDRTIRFWHTETATQIGQIPEAHSSLIWDLALADQGKQLISGGADRSVRLWDIDNDEPLGQPKRTPHQKDILSISVSSDGKHIVSAGEDRLMTVWDAVSKQLIWQVPKRHTAPVQSVAFNPAPDSTEFISASSDGTLQLWDVEAKQKIWDTRLNPNRDKKTLDIYSVAFSADGKTIVSGGKDKKLRLWDAATGVQIAEWETHDGPIFAVAFSKTGVIAAGSGDDSITLWDANGRERLQHLKGHGQDVWSVAFSPDGQYLASGGIDKTVQIWQVDTGEQRKELKLHNNNVASVAFSPDGKQLVSGSFDRTIRLWDVSNMADVKPDGPPLVGHREKVWSVQFMPDGQSIVSGSADLSLRWWFSRWEQWPEIGCDRLQNHPLLAQPDYVIQMEGEESEIVEIAQQATIACDSWRINAAGATAPSTD